MGWADSAIARLSKGETVVIRPRGNSMYPLIKSGQRVILSPDISNIQAGDVVLCKVNGRQYLHLVKSIDANGRYLIGNNKGNINGWTSQVYARQVPSK